MALIQQTCSDCGGGCCHSLCITKEVRCVLSCGDCCTVEITLAPELALHAGTILAQRSTDGRFVPFDPTGSDGAQYPRGILRYTAITDEEGHITNYTSFLGPVCNKYTTSMYIEGTFRIQETVGNLRAALDFESFGREILGFTPGSGLWKLV